MNNQASSGGHYGPSPSGSNQSGNAGGQAKSGSSDVQRIEIEGMKGGDCVTKVRDALGGVRGVTIDSVSDGSAAIRGDSEQVESAMQAIRAAGYQPRREGGTPSSEGDGASTGKDREKNAGDSRTAGRDSQGGRPGREQSATSGEAGRGAQKAGQDSAKPGAASVSRD